MKKEIATIATAVAGMLANCVHAQQPIDSISPASSHATTVNDLALDPIVYLGQVAVVGVVAITLIPSPIASAFFSVSCTGDEFVLLSRINLC